ncbi:hypothetical protein CEUSTIGMA_g4819.t1 [Chlamydomonas eustigma]|uniref:DUF6816 domain-containing protein n=1 Tax=Chlamydomonas eustigma TaxID=1157962 RepID=A0A250X2Q8_9CHLO|nr:hypothetical protein CEUSTIGMA_g4819.t1 [Chlamydomonas eustigma]|eukprot:GAX77373.1 hypothetical protein CEUSTIGMA_g4819.t1 [Chlamydomonas eustigma]
MLSLKCKLMHLSTGHGGFLSSKASIIPSTSKYQQNRSGAHYAAAPSLEVSKCMHEDEPSLASTSGRDMCDSRLVKQFSATGPESFALNRRSLALSFITTAACMTSGTLIQPPESNASKLPDAADRAWEALGGGPPDLFFPMEFLGVWDVSSVLVSVETPQGLDFVPNKESLKRAIDQDLKKEARYQVKYMTDPSGRPQTIFDRRFNTVSLLEMYYGEKTPIASRIEWNPQDPNIMKLDLPGNKIIRTRVTRRSMNQLGSDRLESSEYFEQIYEGEDSIGESSRLKASQCFTKYKWRSKEAVVAAGGGPTIVATQVVSDFLTPFDDEILYLKAMNRPVATYTYKMAFTRPPNSAV